MAIQQTGNKADKKSWKGIGHCLHPKVIHRINHKHRTILCFEDQGCGDNDSCFSGSEAETRGVTTSRTYSVRAHNRIEPYTSAKNETCDPMTLYQSAAMLRKMSARVILESSLTASC